eukprot:1047260-Pelagomonas_calceolata.AAC.4
MQAGQVNPGQQGVGKAGDVALSTKATGQARAALLKTASPACHAPVRALPHCKAHEPTRSLPSRHTDRAMQPQANSRHKPLQDNSKPQIAHLLHTCQVHVLVHDVSVAVLLGRPCAGPPAPGGLAGACLVTHSIQAVEHGHVSGQRLLSDHVTYTTKTVPHSNP